MHPAARLTMPARCLPRPCAGTCDAAAALLGLADEAGLPHLRAVALDFVIAHFPAVAATPAWAALPRGCADAVAAEACARFGHALGLMRGLAAREKAGVGEQR
jgi:hypothetical protein